MRKAALDVVRTKPAPGTEMDTPAPRREYLTEDEVERLVNDREIPSASRVVGHHRTRE
ncbi:MAG: hypothetical protein WB611_26005 [Stellaceae bacterium]